MIVVEFPSKEVFNDFLEEAENQNIHKLRENSTSDNPILMKMNLVGGHAGKSGGLNALEESALDNAFLINLVSNN